MDCTGSRQLAPAMGKEGGNKTRSHLVHVSNGLTHASKCACIAMGAAKAATNHKVVAHMLTIVVHDDDDSDVVGENIHRVVTRYRHRNFEFARKELSAIDRLCGVGEVGSIPIKLSILGDLRILYVCLSTKS